MSEDTSKKCRLFSIGIKARRAPFSIAICSGSTNEPFEFYTSSEREAHINAARIRGHESVGMKCGEKEMYFWGSPVEVSRQDTIRNIRDWLINDGLTNGLSISEELVPRYIQKWIRFGPKCLFCYPSSLAALANMAERLEIDLKELRNRGLAMIIATTECLDPYREQLNRAFGVPVYDSYGLREVGLIGHECVHQTMHCVEEQILLETIDPDTLEPTDGEGELVATNLVGHVMPMIRYRTGDIVTLTDEPCSCGRTLRGVKITGGRAVDFIVTSKGMWLSGYTFAPYLPKHMPGIVKLQAQQDRIGQFRLLLVTDANFGSDGVEKVRRILRKRIQCDDEIDIRLVDRIPPCPSGKHRIVISRVAERLRAQGHAGCLQGE